MKKDLQIVATSCVGSQIYIALKSQYNTPFMWNIITFLDFMKLVVDIRNIDFSKFKSYLMDKRNSVNTLIDDCVTLKFIHYIENNKFSVPTVLKGNNSRDTVCKDIIKVFADKKYLNRILRMDNSKPYIFILDASAHTSYAADKTKNDQLAFINANVRDGDIKILLTLDKTISTTNKNTYIVHTNTGSTACNAKKIIALCKNVFI